MSGTDLKQKLAAILAADVSGYSRLIYQGWAFFAARDYSKGIESAQRSA